MGRAARPCLKPVSQWFADTWQQGLRLTTPDNTKRLQVAYGAIILRDWPQPRHLHDITFSYSVGVGHVSELVCSGTMRTCLCSGMKSVRTTTVIKITVAAKWGIRDAQQHDNQNEQVIRHRTRSYLVVVHTSTEGNKTNNDMMWVAALFANNGPGYNCTPPKPPTTTFEVQAGFAKQY